MGTCVHSKCLAVYKLVCSDAQNTEQDGDGHDNGNDDDECHSIACVLRSWADCVYHSAGRARAATKLA